MMLFPVLLLGQKPSSQLNDLYHFVEAADSLSNQSNSVFYLDKFYSDNTPYKETWRYTTNNGKVIYFEVEFIRDSVSYSEVYYVNRNNLVCSEEYETINDQDDDDKLSWGAIFYYNSTQTKHYVTVGKRSNGKYYHSPEIVARDRFRKRFGELKMHMPMLP